MLSAALSIILTSAQSAEAQRWQEAVDAGFVGGCAVVRRIRGSFVATSGGNLREETLVPICSVTKAMTATLVLQDVAAGKLSLDDPVSKFVSWLPVHAQPITVRQLLTHTSGLANMDLASGKSPDEIPTIYLRSDNQYRDLRARLRLLLGSKAAAAPGTKFDYNNTDFLLLQVVLEHVNRQPLASLLERRIFAPAGMRQTSLASWNSLPRGTVSSYSKVGEKWTPETRFNFGVYGGAGGVVSTLADVAKWAKWTLALPPAVSPVAAGSQFGGFQGFGGYAYRWDALGRDEPVYERPGAIANYGWQITFLPTRGVAVIAFSNREGTKLGSGFERSGLAFDLLKIAIQ